MKKLLTLVLAFTIVLGAASFTSHAEEEVSDVITVEEYEKTMNEIYEKYDSSFEVIDANGVEFISREIAEQRYAQAEAIFIEKQNEEVLQSKIPTFGESVNSGGISTFVMPIDYYNEATFSVRGTLAPISYVGFKFVLSGTVNAQYDTFMQIKSKDFYQSGAYLNYKGYNVVNVMDCLTHNNKAYQFARTIDVSFEWTEPQTNIVVGETVREVCACVLYADDNLLN